MSTIYPPTWSRFFIPTANVVPPQAARPVARPRPTLAPVPPETPRQRRELEWVACLLPKDLRAEVARCLRCTLDFRAKEGQGDVDKEAKNPARTRFGPHGEALWPEPFEELRQKLRKELEAILYTLESQQPRLVRNWMLAMHAARLGQLWWELACRQQDALEEVREGLILLWK
jgi:hypothetical protein